MIYGFYASASYLQHSHQYLASTFLHLCWICFPLDLSFPTLFLCFFGFSVKFLRPRPACCLIFFIFFFSALESLVFLPWVAQMHPAAAWYGELPSPQLTRPPHPALHTHHPRLRRYPLPRCHCILIDSWSSCITIT